MHDILKHLGSLRLNAAECQRISDGATDQAKRDLFARLAQHHRVLAAEVERAIAEQKADPGSMDTSMLARHLATTERHIAEGERQIAAQKADIELLKRRGAGTGQADRVLQVLEDTQATHEQNRVRILRELNDKPGG
jgi:hypothetical protein